MKCEICGKDILKDSQCIDYKYYHNDCIINLTKENKELKEQLEKVEEIEKYMARYALHNEEKINMLNTQQKEFIEYMNKTIEELECDDVNNEELKQLLLERTYTYKEILAKYKGFTL